MNSAEVEYAVARHFGWRQNIIVPNISWGLGFNHELDLMIVKPDSLYAYEVEIKVSVSDLKRDMQKPHGHRSQFIRKLFFAMPKAMAAHIGIVPEHAGILLVSGGGYTELIRPPKLNKSAKPLSEAQLNKLYHLATMRIWTLKDALSSRNKRSENANARK